MADKKDSPNTSQSAETPGSGIPLSAEQALISGTAEGLRGLVLAGRYKLVEKIGSGGWGAVYKGEHLALGTDLALKFIHLHMSDDESMKKRFELEATALTRIDSQYVVKTIDLISEPVLCIVMEFFPGKALSKILEEKESLPAEPAMELFRQICEGLAVAHAAGLVHRDLKPANILVDLQGSELKAKILDFGMAKILDDSISEKLTATGEVLGSPPYMAPEQWSGREVDKRSDIYSLGCIMYEVVTGKPAFQAEYGIDYLNKHLHSDPPSFSKIMGNRQKSFPAELELMLKKCMSKSPEKRYSSASEILKDLERLKAGVKLKIHLQKKLTPERRAIAFFALILMLLAGAFAIWQNKDSLIKSYGSTLNSEADRLKKAADKESEAESKYRQVMAVSEYLSDRQSRIRLHAMRSLAALLRLRNERKEAVSLEEQVSKATGDLKSEAYRNLVDTVRSNQRISEKTEKDLLEKIEKSVGKNSLDYAAGLSTLSACNRNRNNLKQARQYAEESQEISEQLLEPDDPKLAERLYRLAVFERESKELDEAERLLERVVSIAKKSCTDQLAAAYNMIGMLYNDRKDMDKAIEYYNLAIKTYRVHNDLRGKSAFFSNMAVALESQGKYEESLRNFQACLDCEIIEGRENSAEYAHALYGLARVNSFMKRHQESEKYMLKILELTRNGFKEGQPLEKVYRNLYFINLRLGKEKEAEKYLELSRRLLPAQAAQKKQQISDN